MTPKDDGTVELPAAPKYGPSAVRDVTYVASGRRLTRPVVEVKQRKNGQYVVVERLPVYHRVQGRNHGLPTLQQSLAESQVLLASLKPDWKPSPRVRESPSISAPLLLPPIDLGWKDKAKALVGSLDNVHHEPKGGHKPIQRQRLHWEARAKVGSLDNVHYKGPPSTTQSEPVTSPRVSHMPKISPRYGALAAPGGLGPNMHYTPGGAEVYHTPHHYSHVSPRVGSLDNVAHVPSGGEFKVRTFPTHWKAEPKVGSLDNVHHVPNGGDVVIPRMRLQWEGKARVGSLDNLSHRPKRGRRKFPRNSVAWEGRPKVGSLDNVNHRPGGGQVHITNNRLQWRAVAKVDNKPPRPALSDAGSRDSLDSH